MILRVLPVLAVLAAAASSHAITFTNEPIAGDDSIAWSQFGDASVSGGTVAPGTTGVTTLGHSFTMNSNGSVIGGNVYSRDFPTNSTFDPISQQFTLATPVASVGATVFPSWTTFSYHVEMEVFNAQGASLGSVDQHYASGQSSVNLGAVSTLSDIAVVRYTVATDQPRVDSSFSLSPVTLKTQAVPEPATLLVIGVGIAFLKRRKPL